MIYNYTKCESVIAKVMADLNISEKNLRITDIKEWIFEAVDKIGAPMQYITKESGVDEDPILQIHDRQVPIPQGIQSLDAVAYSRNPGGPWIPMRTDTSSLKDLRPHNHFHHHHHHQYHVPCIHDYHHEGFIEHPVRCHSDLFRYNGMKYYDAAFNGHYDRDLTYFIKPGWIVTNVPKGFVKIAYKTLAVDERGYPLIPDLASYQEAVYWYVVMKLSFPKYLKGQLGGKGVNNAQNTYFYIQQQWNFYRNQAYAECMMPTSGDMETIKNDWTKLIPDWNAGDTFFSHAGDRQTIINDYYNGY